MDLLEFILDFLGCPRLRYARVLKFGAALIVVVVVVAQRTWWGALEAVFAVAAFVFGMVATRLNGWPGWLALFAGMILLVCAFVLAKEVGHV